MRRNLYLYSALLLIALLSIWFVFMNNAPDAGKEIWSSVVSVKNSAVGINLQHFTDKLLKAPGILILQLIVIMVVARIMGYLFQLLGQPLVIGEIVAGLILGPSVLGALFPGVSRSLFPEQSVIVLQQLSQLGLIFFMFIIGMELDTQSFKKSANKAFLISAASIIIPFVSGIILAYYLSQEFNISHLQFMYFALFMGTTMCITAFPILARIVQERKLTKTPVGIMAITVAAIGDVVAWCILAVVIAIVKAGGISHALITILLSVLYIMFMFYVIKPLMYRIGRVYASREAMVKPIVALVFLLILISSLVTEAIGIHALFGAFMAGVVMPENLNFKRVFTEKIEDISLVILLPLFFVSTGLRTQIGLINTGHLWMICLLITSVAIMGKFGGTLLASRYVGLTWNHSLTLSVLMNAKGLMELIVLNIGYELGILSPEVFAMLVIMALITTLLTGPGLNLIELLKPKKEKHHASERTHKIMLSFANPKMGATLLNLTRQLVVRSLKDTLFTALHISPRSDLSPNEATIFEKESFASVRQIADKNKLAISTIYVNTSEIFSEIIKTCKTERPDFLVLGSARSVFSKDIVGGMLKKIMHEAPCDVLIFNARNFNRIQSVLIIYFGNGDDFVFDYAKMLNHNSGKKFYTYHRGLENRETANAFNDSGIPLVPVTGSLLQPAFLQTLDLVMVSESNWKALEEKHNLPVNQFPSLLIIHKSDYPNRFLEANH
jgi:Kef-type K+ transport system membrane component KefB/nucleotide-binding universal stress UspA family protein